MAEKIYHSGCYNPFLPPDTYIPDGEPKLFDGRVYLYGSKDLFNGEYCCYKYHVYSAPASDLEHWTDHGPVLASRNDYKEEGIEDGIPWSDGLLWAPDVVKRDNIYYLYFCQSDGTEGVAESPFPCGPFVNARQITMGGKPVMGIDPSVLKEGDTYYYTWGQGECRMAKLNDDMCSLDPDSFAPALISHNDGMQGFHEGSSLRKIGDWYCIVYASEYTPEYPNRGGAPVKLDYAVSKNVYGPYERRGSIINNTGIDPQSWNNHGSILKINGQWYVFYHGSSNNTKYTRRSRVERIEVDEEKGLIREAQMTSSGFAASLDPAKKIPAVCAYQVSGGAYLTEKDGGFPLVSVRNGGGLAWRYVGFEREKKSVRMSLFGKGLAGGSLSVTVNGEKAGEGSWEQGKDRCELVLSVCGLSDIRVSFAAEHTEEICELDRIAFSGL